VVEIIQSITTTRCEVQLSADIYAVAASVQLLRVVGTESELDLTVVSVQWAPEPTVQRVMRHPQPNADPRYASFS